MHGGRGVILYDVREWLKKKVKFSKDLLIKFVIEKIDQLITMNFQKILIHYHLTNLFSI